MSELIPVVQPAAPALVLQAQPAHMLGPVADDWAAIAVWLETVGANSRNGSQKTVETYRYHLAKLRWYCEHVAGVSPGQWHMQEVQAFKMFLADVPAHALCMRSGRSFVKQGEQGYTPFRTQPAANSQSDILRFVHAMFGALHATGYLRLNPMALMKVYKGRRLDTSRAVDIDVYEAALRGMQQSPDASQSARQLLLRDRFILIALRELGLRASEIVGAGMAALYRLSDPKNGKTYWVFRVAEANAKGGIARSVPVTQAAMDALMAYRLAFGLSPVPSHGERYPLLLSPRTEPVPLGRGFVKSAEGRRYFGAWGSIGSRHGLYRVVKQRLGQAAQMLRDQGAHDDAERLIRASPHWLRHTFAKAQLLGGIDIRQVASALGHASVDTTMAYTDQEALDLIRGRENAQPGALAPGNSGSPADTV